MSWQSVHCSVVFIFKIIYDHAKFRVKIFTLFPHGKSAVQVLAEDSKVFWGLASTSETTIKLWYADFEPGCGDTDGWVDRGENTKISRN